MITCQCYIDPLTQHIYIQSGVYRGIHYLFLLLNIEYGCSLNRLTEAIPTCTHELCFEQK